MRVEQAIYTSLPRDIKAGYHVVSRSRGVSEADARALATWSPSHGALILDEANRVSLNFHPLSDGRFALSRTCEGSPEYSGRGGRQLYTHALFFSGSQLERSGCPPMALYRDALALGYLRYRSDPEPSLETVELSRCHRTGDAAYWATPAREFGLTDLSGLRRRLLAGEPIQIHFPGDRIRFAECLLGLLPRELVTNLSFSTSLLTSSVRPYRISLLG
jgi:hypothetical protein